MNVFEMLMLGKQISFEDGKIELAGQRVVLMPIGPFAHYIAEINNDPELLGKLYLAAKRSIREGGVVEKLYKRSAKNYAQWFVDIMNLFGLGKFNIENLDEEKGGGVVNLENSPVAIYLKGNISRCADHLTRGLISGVMSVILKEDIEAIETECFGIGNKNCRFIFGKKNELKSNFSMLYAQQFQKD